MQSIGRNAYLLAIMATWFLANGSTILIVKYCYKTLGFTFPFSLTMLHMLVQSILAFLTIMVFGFIERTPIPSSVYMRKIMPISFFFCANIVLGNVSLRYVPVSFMQTLKSLTPVFAAVLQFAIFGSVLTTPAILALIPATLGVALSSLTELSFHLGGFIAALCSCLFTGLKFVLSSALLGGKFKLDAVNMVLYMAPPSVAFLAGPALWFEGNQVVRWLVEPTRTQQDMMIVLASAVISFTLNCSLFMVLKATSSVTVTIAGNLKTLMLIVISIYIFRNPVQPWNFVGMMLALSGITWYGLVPNKWKTTGSADIAESTAAREAVPSEDKMVQDGLERLGVTVEGEKTT